MCVTFTGPAWRCSCPSLSARLLRKDLGSVIKTVNGARRWIDIGPIKIQPSEFAKVTTLVMLAAVMEGVRSWSWRDARNFRAARGRDPAWVVALGFVLWIPVRLAGWVLFPASTALIPWFYLRHGAKWQSLWKPVAMGPRAWDPFVFAGLVAVHPGATVAAVAALPIGLIFIQPDLKSCIVYLPMLASLLYLLTRVSLRTFAAAGFSAALLAGVVGWDMSGYARHVQTYIVAHPDSKNPGEAVRGEYQKISPIPAALLKDYQRERILHSSCAWNLIDPKGNRNTWNVKQAVIATGRGGLWEEPAGTRARRRNPRLPAGTRRAQRLCLFRFRRGVRLCGRRAFARRLRPAYRQHPAHGGPRA